MKKVLALLGVGALLALGAVAAPALAATPESSCTTVTHTTNEGWSNLAADDVTATGGTAAVEADGVRITTGGPADKISAYWSLTPPLDLSAMTKFTLASATTAGLPPSGQMVWDPLNDGAWHGTLVWETSYQGPMTAPYEMADGKWWSTKAVGTLAANDPKTLPELLILFPDTKISKYGINVGAGGPASSSLVHKVKFAAGECIRTHMWDLPPVATPSATPTGTPTPNPVATTPPATQLPTTPATSAPAETTAPAATTSTTNTQAAVVPISEETSLPVTGGSAPLWFGIFGALLLALGTGMLVWYRRRVGYQE